MKLRYFNVALVIAFVGMNAWLLFGSAQYFVKAPTDLLYVLAITLLGGLAAAVYAKLSPCQRFNAKRLLWGAITAGAILNFMSGLVLILKYFVIRSHLINTRGITF